jgi:hypothetical protein
MYGNTSAGGSTFYSKVILQEAKRERTDRAAETNIVAKWNKKLRTLGFSNIG